MAEKLPNALQLREIKFGEKVTAQQRIGWARRLLGVDRLAEALDLFLIAGDEAGFHEIRDRAIAEGRTVLLVMLERAGHVPTTEQWSAAGEAALGAGRSRDAYRCFLAAANEDGLAKVREQIPDYEIYTPQGK